MNAITAELGINTAPLAKGLQTAEELSKATSKKIADDQKKSAKEAGDAFKAAQAAEAASKKAAADKATAIVSEAAKKQKDIATATGNSIRSALSSGSAGDIIGAGFEAIGSLVGPVAGVAAGAALVAKSFFDASEDVRTMKRDMGQLRAETFALTGGGAAGGDLRAGAGKISDDLRARARAKADATGGFGGKLFEGAHANTFTGLIGEFLTDDAAEEKNRAAAIRGERPIEKTSKDHELDETAANLREVRRLTEEATEADKDDLDVAQKRLHVSDEMATIRENELATARAVAAIEREMGQQHFPQADIDKATAAIKEGGKLREDEIKRRAKLERDALDEQTTALQARANAGLTGRTSPLVGARMNIAETRRQEKERRDRASVDGAPAEMHARLTAEADALKIQGDAEQAALDFERAQMTPAQMRAADQASRTALRRSSAASARARDQATRGGRHSVHAGDHIHALAERIGHINIPPHAVAAKESADAIARGFDQSKAGQKIIAAKSLQYVNQ